MVAGTWRTGSLCTRCAARPRPTANARPTTARRGPGRSGPAGNRGPPLLPAGPLLPRSARVGSATWAPPPAPVPAAPSAGGRPPGLGGRPACGAALRFRRQGPGGAALSSASRVRWAPGSGGAVSTSGPQAPVSRCAGQARCTERPTLVSVGSFLFRLNRDGDASTCAQK